MKAYFEKLGRIGRAMTGAFREQPDFIIIGAQKCGTTSLYEYMVQSPHVSSASKKEIFYFDKYFKRKSMNWYRSHFPLSDDKSITGEATANYIFHPEAPSRIHSVLPDIKLIVLLRNPVDRAYSHYYHNHIRGRAPMPFEEAISIVPGDSQEADLGGDDILPVPFNDAYVYSYLSRGRYAEQLERWLQYFSLDNLLVIDSSMLFKERMRALDMVFDYLGIERHTIKDEKVHNKGIKYPGMNASTRSKLVEYYKPYNENLYQLLGREFDWDK